MLAMIIPSKISVGDEVMDRGILRKVIRIDEKRWPMRSRRANGTPRLGTVYEVTIYCEGMVKVMTRLQKVLVQRNR